MGMKHIFKLLSIGILLGACSEGDLPSNPRPGAGETSQVGFRLEIPFETDTSVEPMTRATAYKEWFRNSCHMLILKRIGNRWVVDGTQTTVLDAQTAVWNEVKVTGELPSGDFSIELRPGDYRIVAVLNAAMGTWNTDLVPGVTVADDDDTSLRTPPLLTYTFSTHWMNNGYRQLSREVFVAVADFTVPKAGDLHAPGMQPVTLRAERRVGKFRVLLKKDPSPVNALYFDRTAHVIKLVLTSKGKPFPVGIDALGGMYYGETETYELPWCTSTMGDFHISGTSSYQLGQTNSTVFSPFLFADPAVDTLPFEVSQIIISGASGGFMYKTAEVYERTLATSKISGIVFRTTDTFMTDASSQKWIDVTEAVDDKGVPENALTLFDSYFEWNAEYDKNIAK